MNQTLQHTLRQSISFEGKGLHTGKYAHMEVCPAPEGAGIRFIRTDIGDDAVIEALAENVSSTARSTTISSGDASVSTIEHLMSALTGLGVDNAEIRIDNAEVPILDGSASPYVKAISACGTVEQDAVRKYISIDKEIEVRDEKSGSFIRISPSDKPSIDITVDFGSKVLGVQSAHWDMDTDFATGIGPCRTFVFFHEIEFLAKNGLVKGGDMDNAIVIVEHPVTEAQIDAICEALGFEKLAITDNGYLNNLVLHFPDECGRHKLLDIIGDLRLCGGWLNAKVTAFKPGHTLNTSAAAAVRKAIRERAAKQETKH
ncbi:MAG: UDP-3-O-acyl-N-acetylglucosamine deacetylase [Bacteroidia bacterium]|nr:UDP-3-O-acyl-N-acetylglucosamine deacetylase [Bacteroidia bacterium]